MSLLSIILCVHRGILIFDRTLLLQIDWAYIDKFLSNILTREYISQTWMTILYIIALPFISPVLFRDSDKIGNNADFNYTYAHAHMIEKKESSAMNHEQRWLVSKCYRKCLKSGCGPITITEWSRNHSFDIRSHEKFYYFLVSPNVSESFVSNEELKRAPI